MAAEQKEQLQAVVIADSFNCRFAPVTRHQPRALLPVANVPLIDYALSVLANHGVGECFLYCGSNAQLLAEHVANSPLAARFPVRPQVICQESIRSLGDAMRDLDQRHLVKDDFLLLPGDLVCNANLSELVREHKERRAADPSCIMTLVMKETWRQSPLLLAQERRRVLVTDASSDSVRQYRTVAPDAATVRLDAGALRKTEHARLWASLLDTGLAVCSVHVPPLFSDEFDYRTLDDLVHGVLSNEEIIGNTLRLRLLRSETEFACRLANMQLMASATKLLLDNWAAPLCPVDLLRHRCQHEQRPRQVYVATSALVRRSSQLVRCLLIGSNAEVSDNCRVENSTLGNGCRLGAESKLLDSFLWPGASVGANCRVSESLLCDDSEVLDDCTLSGRCVLAKGVRVGPSVELCGRVLVPAPEGVEPNTAEFGAATNAVEFARSAEEEEEEEDWAAIWQPEPRAYADESSDSDAEGSGSEAGDLAPGAGEAHFAEELREVLARADEQLLSDENMIIEINSIKHAFCVHIDTLRAILVHTVLLHPLTLADQQTAQQYVREAEERLRRWRGVLANYIVDEASQLICLRSFEDACCERPSPLMDCAIRLLKKLYDSDLCEEAAILRWYAEDGGGQALAKELRLKVERMIQWLREADEEESSSD